MMNDHKVKCVFGPVKSRRLGLSLGVDLLPFKTCSMDCIYCECGKTTVLTTERKEYFPTDLALEQIGEALSEKSRKIDFITFSGVGEPTLDTGCGPIIRYVRKNFPSVRICMLTNGSLIGIPEVMEALAECDIVIPSLDGSNADELQKVNRCADGVDFDEIIRNLAALRKVMKGEMWLEIFIAGNINDSEASARRFRDLVQQIRPHKVQLNTLDRPGTEKDVLLPAPEKLARLAQIIGSAVPVECVGGRAADQKEAGVPDTEEYNRRILNLLEKGPMSADAIAAGLGFAEAQVPAHLRRMVKAGLLAFENEKYDLIRQKDLEK